MIGLLSKFNCLDRTVHIVLNNDLTIYLRVTAIPVFDIEIIAYNLQVNIINRQVIGKFNTVFGR